MHETNQNDIRCASGAVYAVREGDTFADIARRYALTAGELAALNPYVDAANLIPGQVLCVPGDDGEAASAQEEMDRHQCPEDWAEGVVQAGETYADLLKRYDVSYQAFRLTNPRLQPTAMVEGQRYCVPPEGTRRVCLGGTSRYVLGPGETLDSLAEKLNVTPGRLLRLNPTLAPGDFEEGRQICVDEGKS